MAEGTSVQEQPLNAISPNGGLVALEEQLAEVDGWSVLRMVEDSKKLQAKQSKKSPGPSRTWEKRLEAAGRCDSWGTLGLTSEVVVGPHAEGALAERALVAPVTPRDTELQSALRRR